MSAADAREWGFFTFGLIVTGRTEEEVLPDFFRSIMATQRCTFKVIRRVGQRSPITSPNRQLKMLGTGKTIPDKDTDEIGLPARRFLGRSDETFVILVDDLERRRAEDAPDVYRRYRDALDRILGDDKQRASVHLLVNMLEAYYFADAQAINAVLNTNLEDHSGDVESIRNPKAKLKELSPSFNEIADGKEIVAQMDLEHVLSRPETCKALRTLFAWCWKAIGQTPTDQFQLAAGEQSPLTRGQIDDL